ncbi:hypothetical protein MWU61_00920 [Loktanella sp. F6476L]|uniref:hypothetical protein n=1 Tax=Loktanella sp. F6476L TaxID=2926405 RepID=UPI001FF60B04|nr:hypothetical protein [Loktanella sp. F6476L]MCK0119083.1 hypothetical protein [Loktanella sp. F6476L]
MKQILIPVFALSLAVSPLAAQTDAPTPEDDGVSLMEEGAKLLLRGLLTEMEPALDDLQDFAEDMGPRMQMLTDQMGPAFADLLDQIDDITQYQAPEFLPNGDIIIRRRDDAPEFTPELPEDIEL